jgi:hypothetical protein
MSDAKQTVATPIPAGTHQVSLRDRDINQWNDSRGESHETARLRIHPYQGVTVTIELTDMDLPAGRYDIAGLDVTKLSVKLVERYLEDRPVFQVTR